MKRIVPAIILIMLIEIHSVSADSPISYKLANSTNQEFFACVVSDSFELRSNYRWLKLFAESRNGSPPSYFVSIVVRSPSSAYLSKVELESGRILPLSMQLLPTERGVFSSIYSFEVPVEWLELKSDVVRNFRVFSDSMEFEVRLQSKHTAKFLKECKKRFE